MYEFKFSSAVNSSIENIQKSREQVINRLDATLFSSLAEKYSKEQLEELFELIDKLGDNPQSEELAQQVQEIIKTFSEDDNIIVLSEN